jgi:hypothetical protein
MIINPLVGIDQKDFYWMDDHKPYALFRRTYTMCAQWSNYIEVIFAYFKTKDTKVDF